MCRRDFQRAGAEFDVHVLVADDGNRAPHERHRDPRVLRQPVVARVVRIDAQRRVAQDGFGARGGHDDVAVHALDAVAQVVELAVRLAEDHLLVREGRAGRGVPVHHAHAAVDAALFVEIAEDAQHAFGAGLVHREDRAVPVARGAQLAQLPEDHAAVLLLPLPGVAQELLARERRLLDALLPEARHDLGLGGDRRMVHARHPAGVLAFHARAAHQHVLQRVVEHVAHVEHARDVGRRNDDRVGFAFVGLRVEQPVLGPVVVPLRLDLLGRIFLCDMHCRNVVCISDRMRKVTKSCGLSHAAASEKWRKMPARPSRGGGSGFIVRKRARNLRKKRYLCTIAANASCGCVRTARLLCRDRGASAGPDAVRGIPDGGDGCENANDYE